MKKELSLNRTLVSICAIIVIIFFSSCSNKIAFQTSTVVPAARGTVTVKKDKNNNYAINMQLLYLAEPNRLEPPKHTYVVWVITENNITQNIGQIKISNSLKVDFETVTPFKPIKIFITAEDDSNTQYPGMTLVLTTNNF